jgi:hypothetical protein
MTLSTAGYNWTEKPQQTQRWPNGTPVVKVMLVAKQHCVASTVEQTKPYEIEHH